MIWIDPSFYEQLYSIIYHFLLKRNAVNSCHINWFSCSKLFVSVVTKIRSNYASPFCMWCVCLYLWAEGGWGGVGCCERFVRDVFFFRNMTPSSTCAYICIYTILQHWKSCIRFQSTTAVQFNDPIRVKMLNHLFFYDGNIDYEWHHIFIWWCT